jgi:predicted metallopeptidase
MYLTRKSPELRRRANKIIKELFPWIREQGIKIGYCYSDQEKKKGNKLVYGECVKVPELYHAWINYDFIIVFYETFTALLTDDQLDILMEHELRHIGVSNSGALQIMPHDVEDFMPIIDKYGIDWSQTEDSEEEA